MIFIIIAILNQIEKSRKNGKKTDKAGTIKITPQSTNAYTISEGYKENRADKAFRESATYQTSNMVNEQMANRDAAMDVLNEFNESFDRMKTRKEANKPKKAKPVNSVATNKKEAKVEVINLSKPEEKTPNKDTGYTWSIFDDFAASDALYLARKDVESRKAQKISYI